MKIKLRDYGLCVIAVMVMLGSSNVLSGAFNWGEAQKAAVSFFDNYTKARGDYIRLQEELRRQKLELDQKTALLQQEKDNLVSQNKDLQVQLEAANQALGQAQKEITELENIKSDFLRGKLGKEDVRKIAVEHFAGPGLANELADALFPDWKKTVMDFLKFKTKQQASEQEVIAALQRYNVTVPDFNQLIEFVHMVYGQRYGDLEALINQLLNMIAESSGIISFSSSELSTGQEPAILQMSLDQKLGMLITGCKELQGLVTVLLKKEGALLNLDFKGQYVQLLRTFPALSNDILRNKNTSVFCKQYRYYDELMKQRDMLFRCMMNIFVAFQEAPEITAQERLGKIGAQIDLFNAEISRRTHNLRSAISGTPESSTTTSPTTSPMPVSD